MSKSRLEELGPHRNLRREAEERKRVFDFLLSLLTGFISAIILFRLLGSKEGKKRR